MWPTRGLFYGYSTAWECVRLSGYDSSSEIPRDELDGADCKAKVKRGGGKREDFNFKLKTEC